MRFADRFLVRVKMVTIVGEMMDGKEERDAAR